MWESKKRFFTQTEHVDIETGELLSKSRIERERWVKVGSSNKTVDKEKYYLKIYTLEYEQNRQTRLFE